MLHSVNSKKHPNDRFIPRRLQVHFDLVCPQSPPSSLEEDVVNDSEFVNYAKVRQNRENYKNALRTALLPMEPRILNFFSPKKFEPAEADAQVALWPVVPRRKPVIGPPTIILDMPNFDSNICHQIADWSSKNCLATIFEREVHMWYPEGESLKDATNTHNRVQYCIKWKGNGTQLAVGLFPNRIGIWDLQTNKLTCESSCCPNFCKVYSFEWIGDNCLVSCCGNGVLKIYSVDVHGLRTIRSVSNAHKARIIAIKVSCKRSFLATSSIDKTVIFWKIPDLQAHFEICFSSVVRAMAWHPWKNAVLAIGLGYSEGRVILWNVQTLKQLACEKRTYQNSSVDCLTFNPISGELVVSYFVPCGRERSKGSGIVTVLSNIDKVVEELHIHNGPIPYLLWDSEAKKLASVSADENLCIWEFFGPAKKENKGKSKSVTASGGKSFLSRACIR